MANPNISLLDLNQALLRCVDALNDSLRIEVGSGTQFEVSMSASGGDSIVVDRDSLSESVNLTSANTGSGAQVISPTNASYFARANIYVQSTSNVSSSVTLKLQLSPDTSSNVWIDSGISVIIPSTASTVAMGTASSNIVAKRARLVSSAPLGVSETATAWVVLGS